MDSSRRNPSKRTDYPEADAESPEEAGQQRRGSHPPPPTLRLRTGGGMAAASSTRTTSEQHHNYDSETKQYQDQQYNDSPRDRQPKHDDRSSQSPHRGRGRGRGNKRRSKGGGGGRGGGGGVGRGAGGEVSNPMGAKPSQRVQPFRDPESLRSADDEHTRYQERNHPSAEPSQRAHPYRDIDVRAQQQECKGYVRDGRYVPAQPYENRRQERNEYPDETAANQSAYSRRQHSSYVPERPDHYDDNDYEEFYDAQDEHGMGNPAGEDAYDNHPNRQRDERRRDYNQTQYHNERSAHGNREPRDRKRSHDDKGQYRYDDGDPRGRQRGQYSHDRGQHIRESDSRPTRPERNIMDGQYSDSKVKDDPIKLEVDGFSPSIDGDLLQMYFESPRKSGGGEIEEWLMHPSKKRAAMKFKDPAVTRRVMNRSHTLEGATLTVVEQKDIKLHDVDRSDSDAKSLTEDDVDRMIEVTGFKPSTDEDTLRMYFENTRKSGGGDVKDMDMIADKQQATIIFTDGAVIDRVLKKSHKLDGAKLTVVETKPRPPRPMDLHRIFLKGVPEDVSQEVLMLYLENRTGVPDEPSVVFGEIPGTMMLYYAKEIPDLDSVIRKFGDKKLKGSVVKAERVKVTDCILVQGLKPDTTHDVIGLYFENKRRSGGGVVMDVKHYEEEGKATVTFEDWTDVDKVCKKEHTLLGQRLTVTAHHECLGTSVSSDGPVPVIPKPIPHPVDKELMEHIMNKHQSALTTEMKKSNIEVTWPHNNDKSQVLLNPIPTKSRDRDMWRQWKHTSTGLLTEFLQTFLKESIPIPTAIWSDFADIIPEIEMPNIAVHQRANKSTITLIGTLADVKAAKATILQTVEDMKTKAEIEAQTVEKNLQLTSLKLALFTKFAFIDDLKKRYPNVQITPGTNAIGFKGIRGEVSESQVAMYGIFESLSSSIFETTPSIHQFIEKFYDNTNNMIQSNGLNALCNVKDGKIHIYGKSSTDTKAAMVLLGSDIASKQMPMSKDETLNALQSKMGTDKINSLNNNEVIIHVDPFKRQIQIVGFTDEVDTAVAEIGTFLDENVIIEKLVTFPPLHVKYLLAHCGKDLSTVGKQTASRPMQPQFNGIHSGFVISGTEKATDAAIAEMEKLKSKIVDHTLKVDKPGMPEFLRASKGKRDIQTIALTNECLIETNNLCDHVIGAGEGATYTPTSSETLCHYTTICGCKLLVCKGDLTKETVDAIVNAANVDLRHIGGLAKAIATAGGATIQQESDQILKQRGKLSTSEAVHTGGGQLPCRHVIHVAGPIWRGPRRSNKKGSKTTSEENLLYDAITNALQEAHDLKCKSVAIPAISAGIYGFPIGLCATTVVEATIKFISKHRSTIEEIRFTNITVEHSIAFQKALKDLCGKDVVDGKPASTKAKATRVLMDSMYTRPASKRPILAAKPTKSANLTSSLPATKPSVVLDKSSSDTVTTTEGKRIMLKKGSLATEQADVIVNTTAGEMDLSRGNVSKALLLSAGPVLQQECDAQVVQADGTRGSVIPGEFIETGPANLKCKKVYHSVCPGYNPTSAETDLQTLIKKLLDKACKSGMTSIAIPAIGTGNLGFPRDVTARVMYETVIEFSKNNPTSSVNDVRFWVYDKDQPTIQAFESEMKSQASSTTSATTPASAPGTFPTMVGTAISVPLKESKPSKRKMKKSASATFLGLPEVPLAAEPLTSVDEPVADGASAGYSEIKIGSVNIRLQQGDLVKENTDAIVNTVGKDLALKGVVSRALVRAGGQVIADECSQIRQASSTIPHIAKTSAGNLSSKHIIHVMLRGPDKVKKMTKEILQSAEKDGIQSIAFPALGTGNLGGSPQQVAPEMLDAIGEFATNENPKNLKLIKLVIFQQDMIPVFEETLKTKSGATFKKPESSWSRGITRGMKTIGDMLTYAKPGGSEERAHRKPPSEDHGIKDDPASITLYIVADDKRKLDSAVASIQELIKDEFCSEEITPEGGESELTEAVIMSIKSIGLKHKVKVTMMVGKKGVRLEGIKDSLLKSTNEIHKLFTRIQADEKRKAEDRLINKEIQWRFKTSSGIYDDYDSEMNAVIERAHREKKPFVVLDLEDGSIRIDLVKMVEIDVSGSNPDMELHRADLKAEIIASSGSILPSSWNPMTATENLKIVPLTPGSQEYNTVDATFRKGYQPTAILKIARIQNKEIYTQYTARKEQMKSRLGRDTELTMYHGTSTDTVDKINMRGFNRSFCGKNAVAYGQGTYFARDVSYSANDRYSPRDAIRQKFVYMCKVLVGDCERGNSSMIVPNQKPNSADIYDSTVDNVQNPSIVVIYHDAQAYPEYLITFT